MQSETLISIVVFSKDRASQLDALLRSIYQRFKMEANIIVIYLSSNKEFECGYNFLIKNFCLKSSYIRNISWIKELNFNKTLKSVLSKISSKYMMFLADDDVLICDFERDDVFDKFINSDDIFAISLRLDSNVKYYYPKDIYVNVPESNIWNWKLFNDRMWNKPISIHGNIYKSSDILPILLKTELKNYHHIEKSDVLTEKTLMICYDKLKLINLPLNRVQYKTRIRCENLSQYFLNNKWLSGYRINLKSIKPVNYNSFYWTVEPELEFNNTVVHENFVNNNIVSKKKIYKKPSRRKIYVAIHSFNRNEDVKFCSEIIKYSFKDHDYKIGVYYNGKDREWERYIEDDLIIGKLQHTKRGVINGINETFKLSLNKDCDLFLFLCANTIILDEEWINRALIKMEEENKPFSAFQGGYPYNYAGKFDNYSLEAFIVDIKWAKKHKFIPIKMRCGGTEEILAKSFSKAVGNGNEGKYLARMEWMEPGPLYYSNLNPKSGRFQNLDAAISFHHDPAYTAKNLKIFGYPKDDRQIYIKKLLSIDNYDWVNPGSRKR